MYNTTNTQTVLAGSRCRGEDPTWLPVSWRSVCSAGLSQLSTPDTNTPHMEVSYYSTSSSSLPRDAPEMSTKLFWSQYKRGRKSPSLWRLLKLVFSKQEVRQKVFFNRTDSLHRFYEELYQRQNSRLQSTLIRQESSVIMDTYSFQSYYEEENKEEDEESLYHVPFC